QDIASFRCAPFFGQPARAPRNAEEEEQEKRRGNGSDAQLPAPFIGSEVRQPKQKVREVGEQNSKYDVELEQADQSAAKPGRRNLGNIHRSNDGGGSNRQSAQQPEEEQRSPAPSEGRTQRGNNVDNGNSAQAVATAEALRRPASKHCAQCGADESSRHCDAKIERRQVIEISERTGRAGDHYRVEAKQQTTEGSNDRAS